MSVRCASGSSCEPIRVLVAEDELLLRSTLPGILCAVAPEAVDVVGTCGTRADALRQTRAKQPDIVLLDLRMPDREGSPCTLGGPEIVAALRRQSLKTRILCLTSHRSADLARSCLAAGAGGFLGKGTLPGQVWEAIRTVHAGRIYLEPGLGGDPLQPPALSEEALRERLLAGRRGDVLRLLLESRSPKEIADALPIGKKHVDKKIAEIRTFLGADTPIRIYRRCRQLGLVKE